MDPDQTYIDMYYAMRDGKIDEARELALALEKMVAVFWPIKYSKTEVKNYLASVLRRTK